MILMFASVRVLSSLFSVEEMGNYYFLLSISGAYGLILANPVGMYVNRKIHNWRAHGSLKNNLLKVIGLYFSGIILLIPFLALNHSKLFTNSSLTYSILALLAFILFTTVNNTIIPALNLLGEPIKFVVLTNLTNLAGLVCSVILVLYVNHDPYTWLFGQAIAFLFLSVIAYVYLMKIDFPNKFNLPSDINSSELLRFGLPIAFTNIFVWGMSQSFRFFLKDNIDTELFGKMVFGFGLSTSLCVAVEYLFQQLYLPKFYNDLSTSFEKKQEAWNVYLSKVVPSYVALVFFIWGLSPFLMKILADQKFKDSFKYLAIGASIELFRMLANVFNMAMHAQMNTKKSVLPYVVGGSFTLLTILTVVLKPELTFLIAISLAGGHFLSALLLYVEVKKFFKIEFDRRNLLKVFGASFIFVIPLFFNRDNLNIVKSILIIIPFGLALIGLFLWQFKRHESH
jgi:O-antigen/teichoic acid export membrane protein